MTNIVTPNKSEVYSGHLDDRATMRQLRPVLLLRQRTKNDHPGYSQFSPKLKAAFMSKAPDFRCPWTPGMLDYRP